MRVFLSVFGAVSVRDAKFRRFAVRWQCVDGHFFGGKARRLPINAFFEQKTPSNVGICRNFCLSLQRKKGVLPVLFSAF